LFLGSLQARASWHADGAARSKQLQQQLHTFAIADDPARICCYVPFAGVLVCEVADRWHSMAVTRHWHAMAWQLL
jgi:hypothetical protein